ncbi:MAG TPA: fimbrial protein, partial [Thermodesulfobacteriota bacterium]|nr:fimbrial protein [Thermodesulfobacteriota bacterium]
MIRINLLPIRAAKKKESVRFQLTVAGLITLSVVAILAAVYLKFGSDISLLGADIAAAEKELEGLKVEVGELTKLKE